jgi:hypothetical protein
MNANRIQLVQEIPILKEHRAFATRVIVEKIATNVQADIFNERVKARVF